MSGPLDQTQDGLKCSYMAPSLRSPFIALLVAVEFLFIPLFLVWVFFLVLLGRRERPAVPVAAHGLLQNRS